jgi:hypothetical protein
MLIVITGCANANLARHERRSVSALLCAFLRFLATDEACLPSAVRTDFGKCAIVRFRFAADAAFLTFFFAALLCFVEAISHTRVAWGTTVSPLDVCWMTTAVSGCLA